MKLFVANPTKQHLMFHYRKPESKNVLAVHIEAGSQKQIENDALTQAEIDEIVRQNEHYGLVNVTEVGRSTKGGTQVPQMVFSVGKPIVVSKIYEALEAQVDLEKHIIDEMRVNTTAGLQASLEKSLQAGVEVLETSVEQIGKDGKPMTGRDAVNTKVTIAKNPEEAERTPRRRRAQ